MMDGVSIFEVNHDSLFYADGLFDLFNTSLKQVYRIALREADLRLTMEVE